MFGEDEKKFGRRFGELQLENICLFCGF